MKRLHAGFTLIELQIVISVISILAVIAVPNLLSGRISANESAAVGTLRSIVSAQMQFRAVGRLDTDSDGSGEYGGFLELSGAAAGRMTQPLVPAVLAGSFRVLNANGSAFRSGYLFRVFLPGAAGVGVPEPAAGFDATSGVDPDEAETAWCIYAWPAGYNKSGNRTFFANQNGDLLATEDMTYSGAASAPASDAAFVLAGAITGAVATGAAGADGNMWKPLN